MRYTPMTEAQIQSMNVMDEGIYSFETLDVNLLDKLDKPMRDKNGNDMAKLKLLVWDSNNRERIVYTFISGDPNFGYKLRHYAKTIGMLSSYDDGTFKIEETHGKSGKAHIVIKKGTIKTDGSGELWPDRNDIKDFVCDNPANGIPEKTKDTAPLNKNSNGQSFDDSDIPF